MPEMTILDQGAGGGGGAGGVGANGQYYSELCCRRLMEEQVRQFQSQDLV